MTQPVVNASASDELLAVEGLRLGYGRADVVHGIGLSSGAVTIVSLIGSNGAGKTTILRSLSGLMKPRAGRVLLATGPRRHRRRGGPSHRPARHCPGAGGPPSLRQHDGGGEPAARRLPRSGPGSGATAGSGRGAVPAAGGALRQQAGYLSGGRAADAGDGARLDGRAGLAPPRRALDGSRAAHRRRDFLAHRLPPGEGRTILLVEQNASAALAIADYAYVLEDRAHSPSGPSSRDRPQYPELTAAYLGCESVGPERWRIGPMTHLRFSIPSQRLGNDQRTAPRWLSTIVGILPSRLRTNVCDTASANQNSGCEEEPGCERCRGECCSRQRCWEAASPACRPRTARR